MTQPQRGWLPTVSRGPARSSASRIGALGRWLLAAVLLLAACAPASGAPSAAPAAADTAEPHVWALAGGMAQPLANGGRVELGNGWAEVRFTPFPPRTRSDLDVLVVDGASGKPARADVSVTYEMIAMEHGVVLQRAQARGGGHHVLPLSVAMPGAWRFRLRIIHAGVASDVVLLIPEVR